MALELAFLGTSDGTRMESIQSPPITRPYVGALRTERRLVLVGIIECSLHRAAVFQGSPLSAVGQRGVKVDRVFLPAGQQVCKWPLLYVEDDDATAYLFQMALSRTDLPPQVFRVTDGEQAILFLLQEGAYREAPRPGLVLLDLNLPRKTGFDVLAEVKTNPRLFDIPIVVFSGSILPSDRKKAMELGADNYLLKTVHFESFVQAAESICQKMALRA